MPSERPRYVFGPPRVPTAVILGLIGITISMDREGMSNSKSKSITGLTGSFQMNGLSEVMNGFSRRAFKQDQESLVHISSISLLIPYSAMKTHSFSVFGRSPLTSNFARVTNPPKL